MTTRYFLSARLCALVGAAFGANLALGQTPVAPQATTAQFRVIAGEAEKSLQKDVLNCWFPRSVETAQGGFYQNFNADWSRAAGGDKSLVYQARLTWIAAEAARRFPAHSKEYSAYARRGVTFLNDTLWDKREGGFFWEVNDSGEPGRGGEKHAYGIAFAIYAAATAYKTTKDPQALELAKRGFLWLDGKAHDTKNGGYYEALNRDGTPILAPPWVGGSNDAIGTRKGWKSMNTHIHLLEAFTALYEVWSDAKVRARLQEIFDLLRDKIAAPAGYLNLYFTPNWKPVSFEDSYGHDIETSYLLIEASAALGKPNDPAVWTLARRLADHALQFGGDATHGGIYDSGPAEKPATQREKIWWTQAEGLNTLLLLHERYGKETPKYGRWFVQQWTFIRTKQIDAVHGGWRKSVSPEGVATPGQEKSDGWTDPYHQGRALLNVSAALRRLTVSGN